ncbi:MAG: ParB/RepB/Spo0J family partition protein [Xanthomonadales bacterium]|nr:ParB/RepB/Spo0J family partition protein [Xanthomonadales bacterium]
MFTTVPLSRLIESPQNTRRHWNAAALDELVASLKAVGVLTPLLVRPVALDIEFVDSGDVDSGDGDWEIRNHATCELLTVCSTREQAETWSANWRESERCDFEIAAGHRRFRAAQRAGLDELPVQIRDLGDREFLEVLTIENLQREDVHPLDEAEGYATLQASDRVYTVEAIAARVGKSTSYVRQRLALRKLTDAAKAHFLADEITAAHAVRLARLSADDQGKALEEAVFSRLFGKTESTALALMPVSDLDDWVRDCVRLDVHAPETAEQFPEIAAALAAEAVEGATILQLDAQYHAKPIKNGPLTPAQYHEILTKKDHCPHAQPGVFVLGARRGEIVQVCAQRKCQQHWPVAEKSDRADASTKTNDDWKQERERIERQAALWTIARPRVEAALVEATRDVVLSVETVNRLIGWKFTEILKVLGTTAKELRVVDLPQVMDLAVTWQSLYSADQAKEAVKRFGVDVKAIMKAVEKEQKAAAPTTAKTSVKKAATPAARKAVA